MHPADLFTRIATRNPNSIAIIDNGTPWTYQKFLQRTGTIAGNLAVGADNRVLIALPPSVDAYTSIFASLLSGATHTPVNVSAPILKLQNIASQLDPHAIIAEEPLIAQLGEAAPKARRIVPSKLEGAVDFVDQGYRSDLAYIMFTSGSTGRPKGVVVPAIALANYVAWCSVLECKEGDRVSQQPNLGFDISMTDIFGALCYGATLVPLVRELDRLMPARFIKRERITVWNSTPSAVSLMMTGRQLTQENLASLRLINFCGEALAGDILEAIFQVLPDVIVQNTYGPTEATVAVTNLRMTKDSFRPYIRNSVSIGAPIPGMSLHLVGGGGKDEGEIVICGPQLSRGYWLDSERTDQSFRSLEIEGEVRKGYLTGDWAERHDGNIYFRERLDFQIKVNGYRIELDEVAAAIRSFGWPTVATFKRGESIAAIVEKVVGQEFNEDLLKENMRTVLERHAVPERILVVDRVPRNDNDKIDRRASSHLADKILSEGD